MSSQNGQSLQSIIRSIYINVYGSDDYEVDKTGRTFYVEPNELHKIIAFNKCRGCNNVTVDVIIQTDTEELYNEKFKLNKYKTLGDFTFARNTRATITMEVYLNNLFVSLKNYKIVVKGINLDRHIENMTNRIAAHAA